jgi:hypothetical protein
VQTQRSIVAVRGRVFGYQRGTSMGNRGSIAATSYRELRCGCDGDSRPKRGRQQVAERDRSKLV